LALSFGCQLKQFVLGFAASEMVWVVGAHLLEFKPSLQPVLSILFGSQRGPVSTGPPFYCSFTLPVSLDLVLACSATNSISSSIDASFRCVMGRDAIATVHGDDIGDWALVRFWWMVVSINFCFCHMGCALSRH
jgi:hypothetical protein